MTNPELSGLVRFGPYLNGFYDVARQWPDDFRRRVEASVARAAERRRAIRTQDDARAYQRYVRERFWASMGGIPGQSGAPGAAGAGEASGRFETLRDTSFEVVGQVEHLGLEITRLVFDSHPGVPVSALLYRHRGNCGRRPAVLFLSGHHETAKHHPEYQRVCMDLALHDLVVLSIDPWGQGERFQYVVPGLAAPLVATGTYEHSYCGLQCFLTGGAVARHFAWDAVRGLDVLAGLPDVDPARIGVTGNSGGGTQTTLLMLADQRLAAAAPVTYISGTTTYARAGLPHDAEQNFVGMLAGDLEQTDLLASFAPRPLLVAAVKSDFFPVEATEQTVEAARAIYATFGAADKIRLVEDDDRHWYTDVLRAEAVRFFTGALDGEARYHAREISTLPPESLWCSPTGQLYRDRLGSRTVFDLNQEFLAAHRRPAPITAQDARSRLAVAVHWPLSSGASPVPPVAPPASSGPAALPIRPRYFPPVQGEGFTAQRFFFFSEPEIAVSGTMLRPHPAGPAGATATENATGASGAEGAAARTWLVLLPDGTASDEAALAASGVLALVQAGDQVCLFDPRGRGAVRSHPTQGRDPDGWLGFETYNSYMEMQFDSSTVAARVFDVARAVEFLLRHEPTAGGLALRGHGTAALWGYLAAALDERIRAIHLTGMLPSWNEIVATRLYDSRTINASVAIPGVLQQFDLPDLAVCFQGRELTIRDPLRVAARPEHLPFQR